MVMRREGEEEEIEGWKSDNEWRERVRNVRRKEEGMIRGKNNKEQRARNDKQWREKRKEGMTEWRKR